MTDALKLERPALSRDYSQFLVELSIALHKFSMYPGGHPALGPATDAVIARAEPLLVDRPQIAFGVARRQLIIEGIATHEAQPVLRRLAEGLHRHHLGAVTVLRGLEAGELTEALRALAREPEQGGPLGLQQTVAQLTWPHLRLHPLTFDGLTLASDVPMTGTAGSGGGLRGAELWIGLARAAMSGGQSVEPNGEAALPPDTVPLDSAGAAGGDVALPEDAGQPLIEDLGSDAARLEPTAIARAIDARAGAAAYDQVIVGYLLQIARELRAGGGADMTALRRRTARLIRALSPETLRRLVEMGGDLVQRRAFVLDASQGMAVDSVIDIVRAAADASGQTISHGLVRMLSKLAAHAEFGEVQSRSLADAALREQVGQLLAGWQLADPNPSGYTAVLHHVAVTPVAADRVEPGVWTEPLDPLRLVQMSLEVGQPGPMLDRAVETLLADGRASALLDAVDGAPAVAAPVAERLRTRLVGSDGLRELLDGAVADFDALERLEPFLTDASYAALLDLLVSSEHRIVRRRLLERLARAPVDLGPLVAARLQDARWFVQRNMLVLLERIGRMPEGVALAPFLAHDDVRVRHEAIRVQLRLPGQREAAVRAALADGHPRLVHRGLVEVQHDCPVALLHEVAAVALDGRAGDDVRGLAVRALAHCADRGAVEPLLGLVASGRTLFGRPRLSAKTPVMLGAVAALAAGWRSDPRAAAVLRLAAASSDDDVRRAAAGE